jgi:hypothetical protein
MISHDRIMATLGGVAMSATLLLITPLVTAEPEPDAEDDAPARRMAPGSSSR